MPDQREFQKYYYFLCFLLIVPYFLNFKDYNVNNVCEPISFLSFTALLNNLLLSCHNLLVLPHLLLDVLRLHLLWHHWLGLLLSNIHSNVPLFLALLLLALQHFSSFLAVGVGSREVIYE